MTDLRPLLRPRAIAVVGASPRNAAATLAAIGDLALTEPRIESVEVNPLIVTVSATTAVDAVVIVS